MSTPAPAPEGRPEGGALHFEGPFTLECGRVLPRIRIAYETWGEHSARRDHAVLVCHALTGDAHASSFGGGPGARPGWWDGLIGRGRAIDPDRHFILCANLLGSCFGSTGPASTDPETTRPYGREFPTVTPRDMARVQKILLDHLGVGQVALAIGGSLGAMIVWEMAVEFPSLARAVMPIAGPPRATPWSIALNEVARRAIALDSSGEDWGGRGLALARSIAMISYRTGALFEGRFGREREDPSPARALDPSNRFQVGRYLDHQGQKFLDRFDTASYITLTHAMDLHDVGRSRGGIGAALARIRAAVYSVGISGDVLFPASEMRDTARSLSACGGRSKYGEIESTLGHDAFLAECDLLGPIVRQCLEG
jgi:homoserine O-acetyltransferase/O-succinyltransferase